jgi:transcriptional regulator with XRE-family HTH domain
MTTRYTATGNGHAAGAGLPGSPGSATTLIGPTIRRRRLGARLRSFREASGLRIEDVAVKLGVAPSTVSRIETGKAPARTSYVTLMLDAYGVTDPGQREHLMDLAREGQRKGWWAEYDDLLPAGTGSLLDLEADAGKISVFAADIVPGLLQTAGYAAAVARASRPDLTTFQYDKLVTVTLRRQEPACGHRELHAIIDESALLRTFGSAQVMAAQLGHLSAAAASPLITVQVLRLATFACVLSPGFTILSFTDEADADAGCRDGNDEQVTLTSDGDSVSRLRSTFTRLSHHADTAASSAALIGQLSKHYAGQAGH